MDVNQCIGICIWKCKHGIDRRVCHSCFYTQEFDRLVEAHHKVLLQRFGREFDVSSRNKRHNDAADRPDLSNAESKSKQQRVVEFNHLAPNASESKYQPEHYPDVHRARNGIQTHESQPVPWVFPLDSKFNRETSSSNIIYSNHTVHQLNASSYPLSLNYESKSNT